MNCKNTTLDHQCLVSDVEYIDATLHPPSDKGIMYLLSVTGKASIGTFVKGFHVAWFPLLKRPSTLSSDKMNLLLKEHLSKEKQNG